MLCSCHFIVESVSKYVPCVEGYIPGSENVSVIDGSRAVNAVGLPFLQVLAHLFMVVVCLRSGISESGETASLAVSRAGKTDKSLFHGTDQPETVQSLVTVWRIGLCKRGRNEMQPHGHVGADSPARKLRPYHREELHENARRGERAQLSEARRVLVPQSDMVYCRGSGQFCVFAAFGSAVYVFAIDETDTRQTRLYIGKNASSHINVG